MSQKLIQLSGKIENRDVHVTKKVLTTMRTAVSAFEQYSVCAEEGLPPSAKSKNCFLITRAQSMSAKVGISPPLSSPGRSTKRAKNCRKKNFSCPFSPVLNTELSPFLLVMFLSPSPPRTRKPKINCPELGEVLKCPFYSPFLSSVLWWGEKERRKRKENKKILRASLI